MKFRPTSETHQSNSFTQIPFTFSSPNETRTLQSASKSQFLCYSFQECCLVRYRKILRHWYTMPQNLHTNTLNDMQLKVFRHASYPHVLLSLCTWRLWRGQLKSYKDLMMPSRMLENFHFDFCLCSGSGSYYLFSQPHTHFSHFSPVTKEHWKKTRSLFSHYLSCPLEESFPEI